MTDDKPISYLTGDFDAFPVGGKVTVDNCRKRPWYKRAWEWVRTRIFRRRPFNEYTVTAVNNSTIFEVDRDLPKGKN